MNTRTREYKNPIEHRNGMKYLMRFIQMRSHTYTHRARDVCFQCSYLFVIVYTNKQASTSYLKKITFSQYILWIDRKRECTIWFVCDVHVLNGIIFAHFEMASCWDLRTQSWSIPHPPSIHFEQFNIRHTNSVFSVCLWLFALKIAQS